jgi:multidrug resistance efflux pump
MGLSKTQKEVDMASPESIEPSKEAPALGAPRLDKAEGEIERAERDLREAKAEIAAAEAHLHRAEGELHEAEQELRHREVEIKVDGRKLRVRAGVYIVAEFKKLVGVAADRELDLVKHDTFKPLADDAKIRVHEHEVFVSHVRTGGSS